jgi:hypothetical protein
MVIVYESDAASDVSGVLTVQDAPASRAATNYRA